MTLGLTAPIVAFGALSVKAAMDFESSFAGVRKTVDATEEEYAQLAQSAKDMSEQKVVSASQVNDIMALAGQLGIANENLVDYAGTIADLDVATNLNAEEAATQIAQYTNITGMAQTQTSNFAATLVDLGNNYATTEADIMSMSMRVAASGSQIGLADSEILALSASLASVGINAEAGGTAISTIMSQIDRDVALGTDTLEVWADTANMSADEFVDAWENRPVEALQALFEGMSRVQDEGGNLNLVLDQLGVTALRQTDVMKRLGNASELFGTAVGTASVAWDENSAHTEEAAKRYETTESSLAMLKNTLTNTAAEMGGPLLGAVNEFISGAKPFLDVLKGMAKGFAEMDPSMQAIIIGLVGTVAAAGPVVTVFGKLMETGAKWSKGLAEIRTAMDAEKASTTAMTAASTRLATAEELVASREATRALQADITAAKKAKAAAQEQINSMKSQGSYNAEAMAAAKAEVQKQKEAIASARVAIAKEKETQVRLKGVAVINADAAATAVDATAKAGAVPPTNRLTAAQTGLNTAMKANPIGLVISAIMILLPLAASLGSALMKASESSGQLTQASQRQKTAVDNAREAYKKAVDTHGEISDQALAAKDALAKESQAFEDTKQTLNELTEQFERHIEVHDQMMSSITGSLEQADAQSGALLNLRDRIVELTNSADGSVESEMALGAEIAALAQISPEAAAGLDAVTLAEKGSSEASEKMLAALDGIVEAEKGRIQLQAAHEAYAQLVQDEATLMNDQATAAIELEAANVGLEAYYQNLNLTANSFGISDPFLEQTKKTSGAVDDLTDKLEENRKKQQEVSKRATELATRQLAVEQAAKAAAEGHAYTAAELEKLGITEEEVTAEIELQESKQVLAVEQAKSAMVEAIDEYVEKNSSFARAMQDAGIDSETLAARLSDVGMTLGDITGNVMTAADAVKSGMEEMVVSTEVSATGMKENMDSHTKVLNDFADNLTILASEAFSETGTEAQRSYVQALQNMDPQIGAAIAQELVADMQSEASAGLFDQLADSMQSELDASTRVALASFVDEWSSASTEQAPALASALASPTGEALATEMDTQGEVAVTRLAQSITDNADLVQEAFIGLFDGVADVIETLDLSASGAAIAQTYATGISSGNTSVRSSAKSLSNTLVTVLGAIQLMGTGAKAARDFASGVSSGQSAAKSAGTTIGDAALSGARAAAGGSYSIGYSMSSGIASGILSGRSRVINAMAAVVADGIAAGKRAADSNSPSRKSRNLIGRPLGEGVAVGVTDEIPAIERSMATMMDAALTSADKGMQTLVSTLDLSGYDLDGFRLDTSALEIRGSDVVGTSSVVNNYYAIDGIDITGDAHTEAAVDVILNKYQRLGRM
jgi:TP901 family phage tail tape measure protein